MGKLSLGLGLGIGYVLGTRAGRARYEQIQQAAARLTGRPEVQEAVGKVRESLPTPLQSAVDGLVKTPSSGGSSSGGSSSGGSSSGGSSSGPSSRGGSAPATSTPPRGEDFALEDDEEVFIQPFEP